MLYTAAWYIPRGLFYDKVFLPNLIITEKEYDKKQTEVVRFRISSADKSKIEKKEIKKVTKQFQIICVILL